MTAHVEGVDGLEPLPLPIKHSESILPSWLRSMHNIPDMWYLHLADAFIQSDLQQVYLS